MRGWIVAALVVAGCGGADHGPQRAWMESAGRRAATWEPCLRIAVAMRAACGADAACADAVTQDFSYACYLGRYQAAGSGTEDPMTLSPCLWGHVNLHGERFTQEGEPGYVGFDAWARALCDRDRLPAAACTAELRAAQVYCPAGLGGAGP